MDVTKQEFNLRDLGTKSVTLFPSRAQVVRELKDVHLAVSPRSPSLPLSRVVPPPRVPHDTNNPSPVQMRSAS